MEVVEVVEVEAEAVVMVVGMVISPQGAIMNAWSTRWNMGWFVFPPPKSLTLPVLTIHFPIQVRRERLRCHCRQLPWEHWLWAGFLRQHPRRLGRSTVRAKCLSRIENM
jgi:hypothetical protein